MNILLINTHLPYPNWSEGGLTRSALDVARAFFTGRGDSVVETVIAEGYDVAEEEQKILSADGIIVQAPINWFSAPWIWKKYVDEVFNAGLHNTSFLTGDGRTRSDETIPYGSGGLLQGKKALIVTTWNAPRDSFDNPASPVFAGDSLNNILSSISAPFRFCGIEVVEPFAFYDIFKNPSIADDLNAYKGHLARAF